MTTEDQDSEIGRLMRERRDLRGTYAALLAKGSKLGELLAAMGKALKIQPPGGPYPVQHFQIEAGGTVNVTDEFNSRQIIDGQLPTCEELRQFLVDVQTVQGRLSKLDAHLKPFE
jgi:hypothetical protein